jgi:hypothetical protein
MNNKKKINRSRLVLYRRNEEEIRVKDKFQVYGLNNQLPTLR